MTSPVVFVGDSITHQWGHYLPGTFDDGRFVNRGIGGETTRMIALRLRSEVETTKARGLHLMAGLNDIARNEGFVPADAIKANLASMIATARELRLAVWVGSLTPADAFPWNRGVSPGPMIAEINAWLASSAGALGAIYIDYHAVLSTPSGSLQARYSADGVHLTRAGYQAMEPLMLAHLRPAEPAPDALTAGGFYAWLKRLRR